jgi:hypothetical protein
MTDYNTIRRAKYAANPEGIKLQVKNYRLKRKLSTLAAYGNECTCCGETNYKFLTIDHINGGGNQHRREVVGKGRNFYDWLKQNNYPAEFQILCFQCNCGRAHNAGICPHKEL